MKTFLVSTFIGIVSRKYTYGHL